MSDTLPKLGVIIIGLNVEKVLPHCIDSVLNSDYPKNKMQIVYVDGGSTDKSVGIANNFPTVKTISLNNTHPTPGSGRNAGWKALSTPYIQFLDADTVLEPDWFLTALPYFSDPDIAAVCGHRREKEPDKNRYHMIGNMEWNYETGPCRYFGGDFLIKRNVLVNAGGFDENLVAGEDPELSFRIREAKHTILRIDKLMTLHELNMSTFKQYLSRSYRSGHAYAEIACRFLKRKEKLWTRETVRVMCKATTPFFILLISIFLGHPWEGTFASMLIIGLPLLKIGKIKHQFSQSWSKSILYSIHICIVVFPQFAGVMRYLFGTWTQSPHKNSPVIHGLHQKEGA